MEFDSAEAALPDRMAARRRDATLSRIVADIDTAGFQLRHPAGTQQGLSPPYMDERD